MRGRTEQLDGMVPTKIVQAELLVTSGPDKGETAGLEEGPLVIGTDPSCGLVLTDSTVSARHCELTRRGNGLTLRDLGSTNGVEVNGVRVEVASPSPRVKFRLGRTEVLLKERKPQDVMVPRQNDFGELHGESAMMRAVFARLPSLAASDAPLLVEGETGTGKDVTARVIHRAGPRCDGPLVVFDCGAVASNLLEAELFGAERGAFTGATSAREGLALAANGGTLVLDEIGELPLDLQPKLLRLIESKEVRPVGANTSRPVDLRIIACTHRNVRAEVAGKRFREDLYFRLSALRLRLPSLRERPEDLPGLVDRLLEQRGEKRRFADLGSGDKLMMLSHCWPGNVRELRNVVERLVAFPELSGRELIDAPEGSAEPLKRDQPLLPLPEARERSTERFERQYLTVLMEQAHGSLTEAATLSGVSRQFLGRLLMKHGMR